MKNVRTIVHEINDEHNISELADTPIFYFDLVKPKYFYFCQSVYVIGSISFRVRNSFFGGKSQSQIKVNKISQKLTTKGQVVF